MGSKTKIEWTESTWNPVTGCTKISAGCRHCYAERMANRLQAMGQANYVNGFQLAVHEHALGLPLRWRRPQMIFVNSMSDLFHKDVPADFIRQAFRVMGQAHWHRFQVLTKRSGRLRELSPTLDWPGNVWMGVTVESADFLFRRDDLRATGAAVKFLSLEPLLGPLPDLDLDGIDWIIVGGETGPGARPMHPDWARSVRDQCIPAGVPFFFKGWGEWGPHFAGARPGSIGPERVRLATSDGRIITLGVGERHGDGQPTFLARAGKSVTGRLLDGREWNEFPKGAADERD